MSTVQTLDERKRARVEEIRMGYARLRDELAEYGRADGGKFWIYGSAVTDRLHYDSDIDVLVDFDLSQIPAAFDFLQGACVRLKLKLDAQPKAGARRHSLRESHRRRWCCRERRPMVRGCLERPRRPFIR